MNLDTVHVHLVTLRSVYGSAEHLRVPLWVTLPGYARLGMRYVRMSHSGVSLQLWEQEQRRFSSNGGGQTQIHSHRGVETFTAQLQQLTCILPSTADPCDMSFRPS